MKIRYSLLIVLSFLLSFSANGAQAIRFDKAQQLLVEEKYQEAFEIFIDLAENGHPESQYHAGSMLVRGRGVIRNCIEGKALLKKASNNGNASASFAMYVLAKTKSHRCGFDDHEVAKAYLNRAIEQGYEL